MAPQQDLDLITVDIQLPGIDGWELLGRLRRNKPTPVLMLTARDAVRDRVRGLDIGLLPLAPTPFNQSRLPMKFSDYMAAGLHVCCSEVGELREMVRLAPQSVTLSAPTPEAWEASVEARILQPMPGSAQTSLEWTSICRDLEKYYLSL